MIFELIVLGVILLAVGYWATMFAMGRRDDVLHGKFVEHEPDAGPVRASSSLKPSLPPRVAPTTAPPNQDSLQALLTVIRQDLNDTARM